MTRPRIRLREGEDPSAKLKAIYGSQQLDRPKGAVRVSRDGVLTGSPTGFTGTGPSNQKNQDPVDRHGGTYDDDTKGWPRDAGDTRPSFDRRGHNFKHFDNSLKATGKDASKSPFSAAHKTWKQ